MGRKQSARGAALMAAVFLGGVTAASRADRNCPVVADSTVVVPAGVATPFHLNIRNLGVEAVSVFQFPQGGQLISAGTPLDYIYLPDFGFGGTTYASFRVSQPNLCPGPVPIVRVTFVVSGPQQTAVDVGGSVGVRPVLCGVDFLPVTVPPLLVLCAVSRRRRAA